MELKRNRTSNIPFSLHDSRIINIGYEKKLVKIEAS